MPALALSIFLIAVGAILTFAVTVTVTGVNLSTVGVILMAVGGLGVILALLFFVSFAPFGRRVPEDEPRGHTHTH